MIHIVFQQSDIDTLTQAIALDETLQGGVIQIKDEFAVGPIEDIYTKEGYNNRMEWWGTVLEFSPYIESLRSFDDRKTVKSITEKLDENADEQAWIWVAQNQHDVCGYYWLISQLKDYNERVFVLVLNNLPFINEKGNIFYPTDLFEIPAKEFIKAKKLARPVTISEFELDGDEWKKLCYENAMIRTLEGGKKIINKESSYYDNDILKSLTLVPQKLQKIFNTLFGKLKVRTGDVFLSWRIRELINEQKIEITGDWNNGWKEISLKLPAANETQQKPELDITV